MAISTRSERGRLVGPEVIALAATEAVSTLTNPGKSMACMGLTSLSLRLDTMPALELGREFELRSSSSIHLSKSARKGSSVVICKYPDLYTGCLERIGIFILSNLRVSNTREKEFIPVLCLHNA